MSKSQDKRINIQKGRDMNAVTDKRLDEVYESQKKWAYGTARNPKTLTLNEQFLVLKELEQLRNKFDITCNQMLKTISDRTKLIEDAERLAGIVYLIANPSDEDNIPGRVLDEHRQLMRKIDG